MPLSIACFGAAHLDRKAHALGPLVAGSSNPVRMDFSHGGVARNVAENLVRLGAGVSMTSLVGDDPDGDTVVAGLDALGIDTATVPRHPSAKTASYIALLQADGSMSVAMADMAIYDEMTAAHMAAAAVDHGDADAWFIDTNAPDAVLGAILETKHTALVAMDAVSVAKSRRLAGRLDRIDLLFVNRDEAAALSGRDIRAPLDICQAADTLTRAGAGAVVVSMGADGCYAATGDMCDFFSALPASPRDVTGGGDALVAGTLFAMAGGQDLARAVQLGLACAALAVESDQTVAADLTLDRATARLATTG